MSRTKIVASEKAIREYLGSIIFESGAGWKEAAEEDFKPVTANAVVDPSAAATDPSNEKFVPRNRQEFKIAMASLIDDLDDTMSPEVYNAAKKAIKHASEDKDEEDMKKDTKVEESIRLSVRKILRDAAALSEAAPPAPPPGFPEMSPEEIARQRQPAKTAGELPPVKKIPSLQRTTTEPETAYIPSETSEQIKAYLALPWESKRGIPLVVQGDIENYWKAYNEAFFTLFASELIDRIETEVFGVNPEEDQKKQLKGRAGRLRGGKIVSTDEETKNQVVKVVDSLFEEFKSYYQFLPDEEATKVVFPEAFKQAFGETYKTYMDALGRKILPQILISSSGKNLSVSRDVGEGEGEPLLSQQAMADMFGLKHSTYRKYEFITIAKWFMDAAQQHSTNKITPKKMAKKISNFLKTQYSIIIDPAEFGFFSQPDTSLETVPDELIKNQVAELIKTILLHIPLQQNENPLQQTESVMNTLKGRHLVKSYVNNLLEENKLTLNEAQFLLANPRHIVRLKSFRKLLS